MSKRFSQRISILFCIIFCLFLAISFSSSQETVDLSLRRTFGIGFGQYIRGTFTVIGSGSENIVNLTLLFNNEILVFSEGNLLTFSFNTKEYDPGELNITLLGFDTEGIPHSSTKIVTIITPVISYLITAGVILLVLVAFSIKYGPRIWNHYQKKRDNKHQKNIGHDVHE